MSLPDLETLLHRAASRVRDPVTGRSVAEAGLASLPRVEEGRLVFQLRVTPAHEPGIRQRILAALGRQLAEEGWEGPVDVDLQEARPVEPAPPPTHAHQHGHGHGHGAKDAGVPSPRPIPGVHHVVAVASGKGGVGKSTVAVQLAAGLRDLGYRVGIMDADIYGPSLPTMLGVNEKPRVDERDKVIPLEARGLRCMSIGFLVDEGVPLIWRGPMVMGVVKQFVEDVDWAGLDYLVVDLPPGTGDAQLSMCQMVALSGAVIVSTPQELALADAARGLEMFKKLSVPILGMVENMAWYALPGGGRDHPFGEGGARRLAARSDVDLLAEVPLDGRIRLAGDTGDPAALGPEAAAAFRGLAEAVARKLPPPERT